jgi:hypothetical protein
MKRRGETMMLPCIKQHNGLKVAEQHKIQRVECILLAIQEGCQCNDSKKLAEQLIHPLIVSTKKNRVLIFQGPSIFEYAKGYISEQLSLTPNECIQASLNTEGTQFIDSFLTESPLFDGGSSRMYTRQLRHWRL